MEEHVQSRDGASSRTRRTLPATSGTRPAHRDSHWSST
jgi:hypothetical protein